MLRLLDLCCTIVLDRILTRLSAQCVQYVYLMRMLAVAGAGQLEWLLQGKEKSILDDSEAAIDDDNNGL